MSQMENLSHITSASASSKIRDESADEIATENDTNIL